MSNSHRLCWLITIVWLIILPAIFLRQHSIAQAESELLFLAEYNDSSTFVKTTHILTDTSTMTTTPSLTATLTPTVPAISSTVTPSVTTTPSLTATLTPTVPAISSTATPSVTTTPSLTATLTPTVPAISSTVTPSVTTTPSLTVTLTPTVPAISSTATPSVTDTPSLTVTLTPTVPAISSTATPSVTTTPSLTATLTPTVPAISSTVTPSATPTPPAPLPASPIETVTPMVSLTPELTPTETRLPPTLTATSTESPIMEGATVGQVVINEIVTDPQQDWSSHDFEGTIGDGAITQGVDEFIELYITADGLDLTGWQLELLDGSNVTGDLTADGAFQTVHYIGLGEFTNTRAGDYLVLGNVTGSNAMNNDILIRLLDGTGQLIDEVELGNDPAGDGPDDGAPAGSNTGGDATSPADEAILRYPNGRDTDTDSADFMAGPVSLGQSNDTAIVPTVTPVPTVPGSLPPLLISELLYDGLTPSTEGDEFVELCNPTSEPIEVTNYKVGDAAQPGSESMYLLPNLTVNRNQCLVIAKNADQFAARFNQLPDFELITTGSNYSDQPTVPNLEKYRAWAGGSWALSNNGDEVVVLNAYDQIIDSLAYRNGDYQLLGLLAGASASEPYSLQRVWPTDTNAMPHDFVKADPTPKELTQPPPPPTDPPPAAQFSGGLTAYWGHLHAHTSYSDGAGPPFYALAKARAGGLHFYVISDHGWWLTEDEWAATLTQTRQATEPGHFVALRAVEWTHDSAGHLNFFNLDTLIHRHHPLFADLSDIYSWLANNPQVIAQFNHPDPTYGGTFHNFAYHPSAAPAVYLQEIGNNAQGYRTYEASFILSNLRGWRTAPTNNGDTHTALWGEEGERRTGLLATSLTEAGLLEAMQARRVFATEDRNLAVALRVNDQWMGQTIEPSDDLLLMVEVIDFDDEPFRLQLYDSNLLLTEITASDMALSGEHGRQWQTTITARPGHFVWVKIIQADGELAYSAPVWFNGQVEPQTVYINEILPAPNNWDWDGDGSATHNDEWVELFNPTAADIGLGGWQLTDNSNRVYDMPLSMVIPAGGYVTLYQRQTELAFNNGGDTLRLIHPLGMTVDRYQYDHSPGYDESWCRLPDGSGQWDDDCEPTPNRANRQREPAQPLRQSIYKTKKLSRNAWVEVEGRVTAPPGLLGNRIMYIQDESAGILIYLPREKRYHFDLGDNVRVEGNLRWFHEEAEIVVGKDDTVKRLSTGQPPPPLPIHTTALLEPYEGHLVMLHGAAVNFAGSSTFWVDDGTDPAKVYIRRTTGIRKPFIEKGTPVTVVGIVSQYSDPDNPSRQDYRLLLRYTSDLTVFTPEPQPTSPATPPPGWPSMLPETGDSLHSE